MKKDHHDNTISLLDFCPSKFSILSIFHNNTDTEILVNKSITFL